MLGKTDAVITALGRNGEMNVAELAAAVDEPVSSMYRLLSSLSLMGWVEGGSKRGRYRLGLYFMKIARRVQDRMDIRDAARSALTRLRDATGATSFLCLQRGTKAVCVDRLEGDFVSQIAMRLGDSLPLFAGAAPMALYAFLPLGERKALAGQYAADPESRATVSRLDLEHICRQVRDQGFSVSDGDVTPGIAAIGAPVFNHRGEVEAAVSVSGLREAILGDRDAVAAHVTAAAAAISHELGFDGRGGRQ
jgi:DNA-binding IclR family transcriptional regulator